MTIQQIGGRKFLLTSCLLILTFVALMYNKITPEAFLQLAFAVLALYTSANALISQKDIK